METWHKSGGFDSFFFFFIPSTPEGKLKTLYQREINKSGFRIKVVEKIGTKVKDKSIKNKNMWPGRMFWKVQVTATRRASHTISSGMGANATTSTKRESVGSNYTRGNEHKRTINARNITNSSVWCHCRIVADEVIQAFQMNLTGTFRNDAILRKIIESVQIDNVEPARLQQDRIEYDQGTQDGKSLLYCIISYLYHHILCIISYHFITYHICM